MTAGSTTTRVGTTRGAAASTVGAVGAVSI